VALNDDLEGQLAGEAHRQSERQGQLAIALKSSFEGDKVRVFARAPGGYKRRSADDVELTRLLLANHKSLLTNFSMS
jgi:hypothetical protein